MQSGQKTPDVNTVNPQLTCTLEAQEAGDLALAVFLFLVGQQLVNELPNQLLGWSVQYRKHIYNECVHIPVCVQQRETSLSKQSHQ